MGAAGSEDLPRLIKDLEAADSKARALEADDLGFVGLRAKQALPMLMKDLEDPDPLVRISAARAAVLIGDSDTDVKTARAANVPVIAVSFGYTETPARELGADAVIDSFEELERAFAAVRLRST